jgi:hypothetical protein
MTLNVEAYASKSDRAATEAKRRRNLRQPDADTLLSPPRRIARWSRAIGRMSWDKAGNKGTDGRRA